MAWSELAESITCRNHPNENPHPGICSACLRERLFKIYENPTNRIIFSSYSPSSPVYCYYSSADSSSGSSSPKNHPREHQRVASDIMNSIHLAISGKNHGLKKSRSMIFVPRKGVVTDRVVDSKKKKGRGFWSKILHRSGGKKVSSK